MFLRRLMSGGSGGIAEWRNMWNNDVLPHLRESRLVAGPGIRIERHPAGTRIRVISSGGAGDGNGGGVTLAAVVTAPSGAYGVGECRSVTMNSDGTFTVTSGGVISTITPYI